MAQATLKNLCKIGMWRRTPLKICVKFTSGAENIKKNNAKLTCDTENLEKNLCEIDVLGIWGRPREAGWAD